jgi:hypothetical protein
MKNATDVLIEAMNAKGLPECVSTWGRIGESLTFAIQGSFEPMVASEESLKADFFVSNTEDAEMAYNDLESLKAVIQAMVNGEFCGEDLRVVNADDTERFITVQIGEDPVTTSHDFELLVPEQEFIDGLSQIGVEIDNEDLEDALSELCLSHCQEDSGVKALMSDASVAVAEFSDGFKLKFGKSNGWIVVI